MAEIRENGQREGDFGTDLPYFLQFVPREGLPVTDENSLWF